MNSVLNWISSANDFLQIGIGIGIGTPLIVWVISRIYEICQNCKIQRKKRENTLRSLFVEIDHNTRDLERHSKKIPDDKVLREKLSDKNFIPHVTSNSQTHIYQSNISSLHHIDDKLLKEVVLFYGLLDDIRVQGDSIYLPSYKTISVDGQAAVLQMYKDTCEECKVCGLDIITMMKECKRYRKLGLTRHYQSIRQV